MNEEADWKDVLIEQGGILMGLRELLNMAEYQRKKEKKKNTTWTEGEKIKKTSLKHVLLVWV